MLPAPKTSDAECFEHLDNLLRTIAAGGAADRSEAVLYSTCRAQLLTSEQSKLLPGFVIQCLSVARFRDFITLYDPDPKVREQFIRGAFDRHRERVEGLGAFDSPPPKSASGGWHF